LLDQGIKLHPNKANLAQLRPDIYREYLMTAVAEPKVTDGQAD